ncbi:ComF family protein [Marinigracilibium pacificum]|uniref:ComF family protein n=1 Tax=Marinigracilibium pacificum TaxID=2729599 RepID=A0A848IRA1_9BACT|nr:ComF family protein [Marinigracilibium pacificum]NMM46993.1 ComF family protein [Marinigracilibium pacificum]
MLSDFLSLFFPEYCLSCGKLLYKHETESLCINCISDLPVTDFHECIDNELRYRLSIRFPIDFAFSYLYYRKGNIVSTILDDIKYKGNRQFAYDLGKRYAQFIKEDLSDYVLVPVPLHKKKKEIRGFNQSEEFSKGLSEILGCNLRTDLFKRIYNMDSQTNKSRWERWVNTSETYILNSDADIPEKIIFVDDVITTGSTLEAIYDTIPDNLKSSISLGVISLAMTK